MRLNPVLPLLAVATLAFGSLPVSASAVFAQEDGTGSGSSPYIFAYQGFTLVIPAPGVMRNDVASPPGTPMSVTPISPTCPTVCQPTAPDASHPGWGGGSYGLQSDGTLTYVATSATGSDGFQYTLNAPGATSATNYVNIVLRSNYQPVAKFSWSPGQPKVRETVLFTDKSTDGDQTIPAIKDPDNRPVKWKWDFGDSHISTEQNPKHFYDAPGQYTITLEVFDGYVWSTKFTQAVTVDRAAGGVSDNPPLAYAGPDLVALERSVVTLHGTGSGGSSLSYSWTQVGGPLVEMTGVTTDSPTFAAPFLPDGRNVTLLFQLVVSRDSADSAPDYVAVTVKTDDKPPTAVVRGPASPMGGARVTLNGSLSRDPEGSPLSYRWAIISGPQVPLDANGPSASLQVPAYRDGLPPMVVELTVSDGRFTGASAFQMRIQPVTATPDNVTVELERSGADPANITFRALGNGTMYVWDFKDGSAGATGANVTHVFAKPGDYRVKLVVVSASGVATHFEQVTVAGIMANGTGTSSQAPLQVQAGSAGTFPWLAASLIIGAVAVAGLASFVILRSMRKGA